MAVPTIVVEDLSETSLHHESPVSHEVTPGAVFRAVQFAQKLKSKRQDKQAIEKRKEELVRKISRNAIRENGDDQKFKNYVAVSKNRIKYCIHNPYLNPMNNILYYWLIIISLATLYNSFVIIARETFSKLQDENWKLAIWFITDYTSDIIYIVDMIIQCRTGYLEQGLIESKSTKMLKNYIKTRYFFFDVVSIIPLDILYTIPDIGPTHTILRLNRLIKFHRVMQFFDLADTHTSYPNFVRIFKLVLYMALLIHWDACFYFLMSMGIGFGSDSWVYPNITDEFGYENEFATLSRQYLVSLYWSTLILTTIGEFPGPVTDLEYIFVIVNFFIGVFVFATIVGMVSGITTNMNARKTDFQSQLDNIKQYMTYRKVGKTLQKRVIKWFNYLWAKKHLLDEQAILQTLPDKLHAEIAIYVHIDTLSKVKIFEKCEPGFLEELVLKLTPQVYSPGDYICRKDDIGREMYIIKSGKLEVVNDEGELLVTLLEGSSFGEISLLNVGSGGNKRTANVRSVGFSELFSLSKVLLEYPKARALLEEKANEILKRENNTPDMTQRD